MLRIDIRELKIHVKKAKERPSNNEDVGKVAQSFFDSLNISNEW